MNNQELYDWILENLQSKLELEEVGRRNPVEKWCYPLGDYSGRDFYRYIPIENLEDDRIEELNDSVWDDLIFENDLTDDEQDDILDEFNDLFNQAFYALVDENLSNLRQNTHHF